MYRQIVALCFLFIPLLLRAQQTDCSTAITLNNDVAFQAKNINGPGTQLEIKNNAVGGHLFTEEHHSIWYIFTSPVNGSMRFTLVPDDPTDDWDFVVFDATEQGCQAIIDGTLQPLRANLARNDKAIQGKTGLADTATAPFEVAGPNPGFSKALAVKKGNRFLIAVDNNTSANKGHRITMHVTPTKEAEEFPTIKQTPPPPTSPTVVDNQSDFNFKLFDAASKAPLPCRIEIIIEKSGFGEDSIAVFENQSTLNLKMQAEKNFSVNITKEGYLFISKNFRSTEEKKSISEDFFIPIAKAGEMISLPDINFKENTTHLLTSSINALRQIYDFMEKNPKAVIEIRGHVNAPGYDNEGKVKRFSEKRAEEVKNFLVGMGIDGRRMKTAGMGNEFMIYPSPADYQQQKANRRVEIVILED